MMTRAQFEDKFLEICTKHGVKVYFNDPTQDIDNGYAYWNEVHLSRKYSCISIYMAVAFHELAHTIINMKRARKVKLYKVHSCFNEEFYAWFLAQRLYAKYFGKPFSKKMGDFIIECLKTHSASHYSFKNIFGEKLGQEKKVSLQSSQS